MIDREKVINALEDYEPYAREFDSLSVYGWVVLDALALLKEQEAVAPKRIDGKRNHFTKCGNCNLDLMSGYHYCPRCGKAVKWE